MLKKNTTRMVISEDEFRRLTRPLIDLPVSRAWRGYGSTIFLEVGKLSKEVRHLKNGEKRVSLRGQFSAMIQWGWRVERPESIYFGSWSTYKIIDHRLPRLAGHTITAINLEGRLPELVIQLSAGLWIHSFALTEGQTEWCLFLDRKLSPREWLVSERGRLIKETAPS